MHGFTLEGDPRRPPKKKKEREPEPKPSPVAPTGPFKVFITPDAQRSFDDLPADAKQGVNEIMQRLRAWPEVSGVKPLFGKGYAPNKFRMKFWDWRVEFLLNPAPREITLVRIGRRDTFYDEYH
jgi:mRNA-degrading endonuclease RelE of RelBE toxin-antitoxin system